jgi:hypothetical protein
MFLTLPFRRQIRADSSRGSRTGSAPTYNSSCKQQSYQHKSRPTLDGINHPGDSIMADATRLISKHFLHQDEDLGLHWQKTAGNMPGNSGL